MPDEIDQRLGEIETALEAFEDRPTIYDPAEIARAGAFVSLEQDGRLRVERGFVRKDDEAPHQATPHPETEDGEEQDTTNSSSPEGSVQRTVITIGGAPAEDDQDEDDGLKPLPDRLVSELTAHRTLALQDAVANNPHVAMTALLHKLCLDTFQHAWSGSCLEASVRHVTMPVQASDLKDSVSANAIAKRQEVWKADLPTDETALWDWLAASDERPPRGVAGALRLVRCQRAPREGRPLWRGRHLRPQRRAPAGPSQSSGARRRTRHGPGRMAPDGRQLSRPRSEGAHPRSRARGQGRAVGAAHRSSQEGRDGEGGRTAARRHRLVARAAAAS